MDEFKQPSENSVDAAEENQAQPAVEEPKKPLVKAKKKINSKFLTGVALFVALEAALCLITNYVQFGAININLALIPIVVGACFYGPWIGLLLGVINGVITIFAPATLATIAIVPAATVAATVFVCIFKTGLAGFCAGFIYKGIVKAFKKRPSVGSFVGSVVASIAVPVINTFTFILGSYLFFYDIYMAQYPDVTNLFFFLITAFIGVNFLIEVVSNLVIDPAVFKAVCKVAKR